ncbi:hypothetical protein MRB53_039669 [Persea americana]|nr:hypothetical protein MRB53_039669 [Persea americana]
MKKQASFDPDAEGTDEEIETYPENTPSVLPQLLLGGSNAAAQDLSRFLKASPNVLIGTPGRLLEILSSPYVHAPQSSFELLVLDEADRLLDLGFKDDLTKILGLLPKQRRTGYSVRVSVKQLTKSFESAFAIQYALQSRKTPIEKLMDIEFELDDATTAETMLAFRDIALSDRSIHDKAQKAFVSWVRSYSKHEASSIFRVADQRLE